MQKNALSLQRTHSLPSPSAGSTMYPYDERMGMLKAFITIHQAPLTNISHLCPKKDIFQHTNFNNEGSRQVVHDLDEIAGAEVSR